MRLYSSSPRSNSMRACSSSCFRTPASALCCDSCRRFLLRRRGVERIPVIGGFDFRQQLSFAHVLALFHQHPGHPATDQESHVGRFRTFDRTTGAHRFGTLHDGWSSDLNGHGVCSEAAWVSRSHDVSIVSTQA